MALWEERPIGDAPSGVDLSSLVDTSIKDVGGGSGALGTNPKDALGAKKVAITAVPPVAVLHVAMAMMNGASKYGPYNWRDNKVQARIYVDAAVRHLYAWLEGEELADDSGVHHLGHAGACIAILLDAMEGGNLVDDRPRPGAYCAVLKELNAQLGTAD